jgi:hypothetical protein
MRDALFDHNVGPGVAKLEFDRMLVRQVSVLCAAQKPPQSKSQDVEELRPKSAAFAQPVETTQGE